MKKILINKKIKINKKPYLILFFLTILILIPYCFLKYWEFVTKKNAFSSTKDEFLFLILCVILIIMLWLELCATKIEICGDELIYTEHFIKKTKIKLSDICDIRIKSGNLRITNNKNNVIEINFNSYSKKDLILLTEYIKDFVKNLK